MRVPSILTVIAIIVFDVAAAWSIFAVFRARKNAYVRSRGPGPAIVSGIMNILIVTHLLIQEIFRLEGYLFPCYLKMILSYTLVPISLQGYLVRAIRVVILSKPELRAKWAFALSPRGITLLYLPLMLPMLVATFVLLLKDSKYHSMAHFRESCYMHHEIIFWVLFGIVQTTIQVPIAKALLQFGDNVELASELLVIFVFAAVMIPTYFVILSLNRWGTLRINSSVQLIIGTLHVILQISSFAPSRWRLRMKTVPVYEDSMKAANSDSEKIMDHAFRSVEEIMSHEEMNRFFGDVVETFLCAESYWFLNEVQEYERMVGQPVQTRYNKVKNMARTYIKEGSNFEINIESSMRDGVLKVSSWNSYQELSEEQKKNIFVPCAREIRKLLSDNVLETFRRSQGFKEACRKIDVAMNSTCL